MVVIEVNVIALYMTSRKETTKIVVKSVRLELCRVNIQDFI